MSTARPTIFSFFSGAGFLDLGFEDMGFDIAYVNEFHKPFLDAYQHSRKVMGHPAPRFGYDSRSIEEISTDDLAADIFNAREEGQVVGFIGGPPCPDFSVGGKNRGKEGENGNLSKVYVDLICQAKPDFFLFENVKGLYRTKKHREFFEKLKLKLRRSGYLLHERLINSIEYGAPQDRDRIILVGFRSRELAKTFNWKARIFPERTAFEYEWPTTAPFEQGNLAPQPSSVPIELTVQHWFEKNDVANHPNGKHCFTPRAGLARFLSVEEGDDSKKSYKRLHRWRYSPTAAYGNNEVHLHPYEARRISVAEALAIQSLPASFELPSNMTLSNMFKTVGNGVPYLAGRGLAQSILTHLGFEYESNRCELDPRDRQVAA
ncbi:DNA cytosine methyltransferase [Roseobacter sp. N2S]|uniref:DNA cytosine methyltransferase n=1 Tax=Roseobacter sp. N2S TaxID=2663844 RepID=UPI002860D966|nr:DNA cytosine methyltransferase [Roseobacter sp. N2S]MDR6264908.1 DNA (cytosine-5)-methyltransferase 1 [Roseobacter sp. N2S]